MYLPNLVTKSTMETDNRADDSHARKKETIRTAAAIEATIAAELGCLPWLSTDLSFGI
jgi:hypothetical protein